MPITFQDLLIDSLPSLKIYALFLTRNKIQAEDLLQEAAMRALSANSQYREGTNFNAWIHRILKNVFLTDLRRKRYEVMPLEALSENCLFRKADQEDHLIIRDMMRAMDKIHPDQRETLMLVSLAGINHDDAASIMSCSIGTVKSRVWRARRHMEKLMMDNCPALPTDIIKTPQSKQTARAKNH